MREYLRAFAVNHTKQKWLAESECFAKDARLQGVYKQLWRVTNLDEIAEITLQKVARSHIEEAVRLIQTVSDEELLHEGPERVAEKWAKNDHTFVKFEDTWGLTLGELLKRCDPKPISPPELAVSLDPPAPGTSIAEARDQLRKAIINYEIRREVENNHATKAALIKMGTYEEFIAITEIDQIEYPPLREWFRPRLEELVRDWQAATKDENLLREGPARVIKLLQLANQLRAAFSVVAKSYSGQAHH